MHRPPLARRPTPPPLLTDPAQLAQPITLDPVVQRPVDPSRVALSVLCAAPSASTVTAAHKLQSLDGVLVDRLLGALCDRVFQIGVVFYERVDVKDAEDPSRVYRFSVTDPTHAACFNIGHGTVDDSPLISWSELIALYVMPDGTAWAEHCNYHDAEDLVCGACGSMQQHMTMAAGHRKAWRAPLAWTTSRV